MSICLVHYQQGKLQKLRGHFGEISFIQKILFTKLQILEITNTKKLFLKYCFKQREQLAKCRSAWYTTKGVNFRDL